MTTNFDIIITGGGAAGLMAAIAASKHHHKVAICEKNPRVGRKILVTGNGRCNLSNTDIDTRFYFSENRKFPISILDQCNLERTLTHFERMGLAWTSEKKTGRIFPLSYQASAVLDILRRTLIRQNVTEICDTSIKQIEKQGELWKLISHDNRTFISKKVIIATGGKAASNMGSNGSGYTLAEQLGHTIITPFPALVQLVIDTPWIHTLKGIKTDAEIYLLDGHKNIWEAQGEIQFTDYGLSGLPALSISRHVNEMFQKGKQPSIALNFLFKSTPEEAFDFLWNHFKQVPKLDLIHALVSVFHKHLIPVLLDASLLDPQKSCDSLSSKEVHSLVKTFRHWVLPVKSTKSWSEAQVTAGGINTKEIDMQTLESLKVTGIYFAGELLDADGDCGGYNLQWAWSSGWVAGQHAGKAVV